jgi:ribose transport system permease protein
MTRRTFETKRNPYAGVSSVVTILGKRLGRFVTSGGLIPVLLALLIIITGSLEPRFITASNLINVLRQSVYLTIVAVGGMLPVLCAGMDLSVGSAITLTSVTGALVAVKYGTFMGLCAGIALAAGVGAFNGAIISIFRIPPFIMTVASLTIVQGIALIISGGSPVWGLPESFLYLSTGAVSYVPMSVIVAISLIAVTYVTLKQTRIGRYFYAIGGNEEAAIVAGIPIKNYLFLAYVLSGTYAGISGVMLTARVGSGEPTLGAPMALQSITAIALGGVSLFGGEGNVISVVFAAIFMSLLTNAMNLLKISSYHQLVATGSLLIFAVIVDRLRTDI